MHLSGIRVKGGGETLEKPSDEGGAGWLRPVAGGTGREGRRNAADHRHDRGGAVQSVAGRCRGNLPALGKTLNRSYSGRRGRRMTLSQNQKCARRARNAGNVSHRAPRAVGHVCAAVRRGCGADVFWRGFCADCGRSVCHRRGQRRHDCPPMRGMAFGMRTQGRARAAMRSMRCSVRWA